MFSDYGAPFKYDSLIDRTWSCTYLMQCSLAHQLLPKDQQTKPEEVRSSASPGP